MFSLTHFTIDSRANADSLLEKAADFILTPARKLFGGKNFVHLKNDQNSVRYEMPSRISFDRPLLIVAKKIGDILGLVLVPLGLLLKSAACAFNDSTRNTYANWVDPLPFTDGEEVEARISPPVRNGEIDDEDRLDRIEGEKMKKAEAYCKKIDTIFQTCKDNNLGKEFYLHCVENPNAYLYGDEGVMLFSPLELSECSCVQSDHFNRLMNSRRSEIEKRICSDFAATYQDLDAPINLMSLGAGGLLQDWILIGQLIKLGFKNINYVAIEPDSFEYPEEASNHFTQFFKDLKGVEVKVSLYKSVEDYKAKAENTEKNLHAVFAIDFDDLDTHPGCWSDVKAARELLVEDKGKLYMSYDKDDMILDYKNNLELFGQKGVYNFLSNDLKNFKIPQRSISIAASASSDDFVKNKSEILACKCGVPIIYYLRANSTDPLQVNLVIQGKADDNLQSDLEGFTDDLLKVKVSFVDEIREDEKFDLIITAEIDLDDEASINPSLSTNTSDWLNENGVAYKLVGRQIERITTQRAELFVIE